MRGEQLSAGLRDLQGRFPVVGEVRGPGLMVATEFTDAKGQPDKATCKAGADDLSRGGVNAFNVWPI